MSSIFPLEDSTCHVLPRSRLLILYVALLECDLYPGSNVDVTS